MRENVSRRDRILSRWRCLTAGATVIALATASLVAVVAVEPTVAVAATPGQTVVDASSAGAIIFTAYPDMATCEAVYLTDCYEFVDGTVVGELDPVMLVDELIADLPAPIAALLNLPAVSAVTNPCVEIPDMGASPDVMEVADGTTLPLQVGPGSCADRQADLAAGTVDTINGETVEMITPIDAYSNCNRCALDSGPPNLDS